MALDSAAVIATELERVEPNVPELFEDETKFYGVLQKVEKKVISGRDMRVPLQISPGSTFGYVNVDGGSLGRGTGGSYDKALINNKEVKQHTEWTFKAEWETEKSTKAVKNAVTKQLEDMVVEMHLALEGQMAGEGSGIFATISSVATASGSGSARTQEVTMSSAFGAKFLRPGMYVGVFTSARTSKRGSGNQRVLVQSVDIPNRKAVLRTPVTGIIATDKILADGLSVEGSAAPTGLYSVPYYHNNASTGNLLGLSRSNIPEIRATRVNANGGFNVRFVRLALNALGDRRGMSNGMMPKIWCHPAQVHVYESIARQVSVIQKQASGKQSADLYFGRLTMAGLELMESFRWNKTRMDFIVSEKWKKTELKSAHFQKDGGSRVLPVYNTSGERVTKNESIMLLSTNVYLSDPGCGLYIDGLTIPVGY